MKFRFDLLLMRAILLNAAGGFLLLVGIDNGTIYEILSMDASYISEAIIAVFAFGLCLCMFRIWECSRAMNRAESGRSSGFPTQFDEFHVFCSQRRNPIDVCARLLFRAGLLGTVYGFLMALNEVDLANLSSADMVGREVGTVLSNMGIALVTTLTGVTTNIWLSLNQRMLEGGYEKLYGKL